MYRSIFFLFLIPYFLIAEEEQYVLNFHQVKASELIRFISKISQTQFVFDESELEFEVSCHLEKPLSKKELIETLLSILKDHHYQISEKGNSYIIDLPEKEPTLPVVEIKESKSKFQVIKLQYHLGQEILQALKDFALSQPNIDPILLRNIQSIQWVKSTNSLLVSANDETMPEIQSLIKDLDVPQKQVFIELLVVESTIKSGLEFGVNWSLKPKNSIQDLQAVSGVGFDLGVIGDTILHKGLSFFSLSGLVSAIEQSADAKIVLNQKIIAQDNQHTRIFVGDTVPFAGSKTEIIGQSQQTTSNIEYKDIGVSLNITPLIGDDDVITLDIYEEITEASLNTFVQQGGVQGIQTSKTHMLTKAHVPDQHFLILTGMMRNKTLQGRSTIPCLGGIPLIGFLFGNQEKSHEKRTITIFVRPHLIKHINQFNAYSEKVLSDVKPD